MKKVLLPRGQVYSVSSLFFAFSNVKQSDSVNSFKRLLNKGKSTVPNHYYIGSRKARILHTRILTNCSSLNLDLFLKNVTELQLCRCGSIEDAQHFFFH